MTATRVLAAAFLALMILAAMPGAVQAHGDNPHREPAKVAAQIANEDQAKATGQTVAEAGAAETRSETPLTALSVLRNAHPAGVHFPIALLLFAAALEALGAMKLVRETDRAVQLLLYGAAAGTAIAALLGWIHTGLWVGGESTMQFHRWTGTALVPATLALAWLAARSRDHSVPRTVLRVGLAFGVIAVVAQGFWGGELAHGARHLA